MAALEPTEPRRLQLPNERSGEVSGQGGLAAAAKLVVGARASTCGATIRTRPTTPSLELRRQIGARFAHSLAIRQLDAGSCNGCGVCSRPSRPQVGPVPTFHCVRASSRRFTKFALPRTPSLSAGPTRDVYATGMTQSDLCFPLALCLAKRLRLLVALLDASREPETGHYVEFHIMADCRRLAVAQGGNGRARSPLAAHDPTPPLMVPRPRFRSHRCCFSAARVLRAFWS